MPYKFKIGDRPRVRDVPSVREDTGRARFIGKTVTIKMHWCEAFPYHMRNGYAFTARELEAAPAKKTRRKRGAK